MLKIFFYGRSGSMARCWAKLMSESEVRSITSASLARSGWGGRPFSRLRIELHEGPSGVSRLMVWGEDAPGFRASDCDDGRVGIKVEVDGKVVYDDLRMPSRNPPVPSRR